MIVFSGMTSTEVVVYIVLVANFIRSLSGDNRYEDLDVLYLMYGPKVLLYAVYLFCLAVVGLYASHTAGVNGSISALLLVGILDTCSKNRPLAIQTYVSGEDNV